MNRLLIGTPGGSLPPPPTRDRACRVRLSFSGLAVETQQYGRLPWYDPALFALTNAADREAVYAAKLSNGDRHCIMTFDPDLGHVNRLGPYNNIQIPYAHMTHPDLMRRDTREVIGHGLTPLVNLGCDHEDGVPYFQNALDRLHVLNECLRADPADLTRYVIVVPGWDGTFYGWSPDEITEFGRVFRSLMPQGYLAIEHDPGHIPVGGGIGDWQPGGPMSTYDVLLSEFAFGDDVPPDDSLWQVALRLLGPRWVRPADAPDYMTTEYAISKWYLASGNARGPYYPIAFEWWGTFDWVQWDTTTEACAQQRAYLSAVGYGDCTG